MVNKQDNNFLKIRITKEELYFFLLIFSSFTPQIFEISAPTLEKIINYIKILSFLIICLLFIKEGRKLSTISSLFAISAVWYIFSSIINGGSIYDALIASVMQLSISMIIDYFLDKPKTIINVFMVVFEILIYTNLYSLIRYAPDGYMNYQGINGQKWYFLGMKNNFIKIFLPGIMIALIKKEMNGNKYRTFLLIITCFISVLIERSATSLVGLFVVIFYYYITPLINTHIRLDFKKTFIYTMTANILITIFNVAQKSRIVNFIFTRMLDRNDTLTGRTRIWNRAKEMIREKMFIGYGSNSFLRLPNNRENRWVNLNAGHAHNHWLELLTEGGIPFLLIYLDILRRINNEYKKASYNAQIIIKTIFLCFFLICITQPYCNDAHMSLILICGYHINKILPNNDIIEKA